MPLDPQAVGQRSAAHEFSYDWRTLAIYALGVGARRDELTYLYEGVEGGIRALPSFAVVPVQPAVFEVLDKTGGDFAMVVHGAQSIRLHGRLPPSGRIRSTARISGIYDLKRFAQVVVETTSELVGDDGAPTGGPVFETSWSIIYRGAGGFGGPRPPENDAPSVPKDREPDFVFEQPTSPEQALLYRLSGDTNPLHADPALAEKVGFPQGPILHGLCTYGIAGRAVLHGACGGDPSRLRALHAQFRKPVWPGDTLVVRGFHLDGGRVALSAIVKERDEAVLGGAYAEIG
jgi:acyl dehydratase